MKSPTCLAPGGGLVSFVLPSRAALTAPDRSQSSMSTSPLVSIGLFLYNGERLLEAALDSFLNQTFKNFEIIISDDCSTDRSEEICRRYAARDSRIRYGRNQRKMGAAWNVRRVYELATGKYFMQAAQDGMIQPDFLSICLDALEADDSLVFAHSLTRVIDEGGQLLENYDDRLRSSSLDPLVRARDLLVKSHRCHPISGLIRQDALRKLPLQGKHIGSGRVLLLQLALLGRFYEVPEFLYIRTRHSGQSPGIVSSTTARKAFLPEWNLAKGFILSVARSQLGLGQRLRCYSLIATWAAKYHRRIAKDLLIAPEAADAPAKIVSLDLNTRRRESIGRS
jgi:glycosyltransferase involved in cell wall biosynthesis